MSTGVESVTDVEAAACKARGHGSRESGSQHDYVALSSHWLTLALDVWKTR